MFQVVAFERNIIAVAVSRFCNTVATVQCLSNYLLPLFPLFPLLLGIHTLAFQDMRTFQKIMRYNDFKNDPFSEGNPDNAICARGDLRTDAQGGPTPGGCLDAKCSDFLNGFHAMRTEAVNGPTSTFSSNGPGQPPFSWDQFPANSSNFSHVGQAERFDFVFDTIMPDWPAWEH